MSGPDKRKADLRGGLFMAAFAMAVIVILYGWGGFTSLESTLADSRFSAGDRQATGDVVIVAIDAPSIQSMGAWPWPRTHHARVIEKLLASGARLIAMDVDFSSPSDPVTDAAFARVLDAAGKKIVLPVFKQWVDLTGSTVVQTEPMEAFSRGALLASVNVRPGRDSLIRTYERFSSWHGDLIPSMAIRLANRDDRRLEPFEIDYSINARSIPIVSYADIFNGNYDDALVRGRSVIIGSTAVELGDQLAVPVYRAIPGVVLQALATESILLGRTIQRLPWPLALAFAALVVAALGAVLVRLTWKPGLAIVAVSTLALPIAALALQEVEAVSADVSPAIAGGWLVFGMALIRRLDVQSFELFKGWMSARHRNALMSTVFEGSADGIIVVSHENRVVRINSAAAQLLALDSVDVVGEPIEAVFSDDEILSRLESRSRATATEPVAVPLEMAIQRHDGSTLQAEVSFGDAELRPGVGPFERRTESRIYPVITFRDISMRKAAQTALVIAAERAMDADRSKAQFVAAVSHELRSPLSAVSGLSDLIRNEVHGPVGDARYRDYAEDIRTNSDHLKALVDDVLTISSIDAGGYSLREEALELATVVGVCLRMAASEGNGATPPIINNVSDDLPLLWADERALRQILLNVLMNAIKFTPTIGHIGIAARETRGGELAVTIEDSGIGIPQDQLDKVKGAFCQASDVYTSNTTGVGLGLHIVEKLMTLHDGVLRIDSIENKGTTVTLLFPKSRLRANPAETTNVVKFWRGGAA